MEKTKKLAKRWVCIAIGLMLLSGIVVSAIQTNGGKVTVKELKVETDDGFAMSCLLYVPNTATADSPAPGIVTSHGSLNNKEMQDANCVELARRGYVVLAEDMTSHGDTDIVSNISYGGVYQGAVQLSRLPFVDKTKIGVTGHSAGGGSCNKAIVADNAADKQVISAVLLNCCDATYVNSETKKYANIYGSRDVGILSAQYDEFFHTSTAADGTKRPSPFFMETANAQSFLNFGVDPTGLEARTSDTIYHETIDGQDTIRVIYRPAIIHPWSHFSARATSIVINYFNEVFGAPNAIGASNQVWQWKEAFNFIGLIGFAVFLCCFGILMVFTPYFADLRASEVVLPAAVDKKGKRWFWISLGLAAVFSSVSYLPILKNGTAAKFVRQTESYGISCWAAACGLFAILMMVVFYRLYGKKHGFDLVESGVKMPAKKLGKTILLALILAGVSYAWVFVNHYFFLSDFRIWTLALKTFESDKLYIAAFPYFELFLIYYVASSVANNCFNYNTVGGKSGFGNMMIVAVAAAFPALIIPWIQYITYFNTKYMMWGWTDAIYPMWVLWLFPMVLILPAAAIISRVLYKVTKNPYLAGITNALIVTILTCANTSTKIL